MGTSALEFEKPIAEIEKQIDELKRVAEERGVSMDDEVASLGKKLADLRTEIYENLTPIQRVQVARSPKRPFTLDYVRLALTDWIELHGDRAYRDDAAIRESIDRLARLKINRIR
ncbi:MAG: acetyl-CoA carboxylase carboxyl transferase subunit alpha, partial [Gemmatimonadetes bacterium]|nr:acetyl-CoA carboxylase carboxyl transferase subunit alpha [Gemmatimonadota bacterium]